MHRPFSVLLSLFLCAGLLAACENPFATTYRPVTTAPASAAVPPEEISLREVDDLAAAEAELENQGSVKLGEARFRSHWTDDGAAREQAAAVGADIVLIERTDTRVETVERKDTRIEVEHTRPRPGAPLETITREVPVYSYEERQWFEIRATFWRAPG